MIFWFILVGLPVLDTLFWWWADHRLRPLPKARWYRLALSAFMMFQLTFYAWMIVHRVFDIRFPHPTIPLSLAFVWHLLVLPITMAVLIGWYLIQKAIQLVLLGWNWIRSWRKSAASQLIVPTTTPPQGPTRREFLAAVAVATPPLLTSGSVARAMLNLNHFRVQTIDLPIPGLAPALEGLRIAHVSDLHAGRFTTRQMFEQIIAQTNALNADLVAFTGDLIDFSLDDLPPAAAMLKQIRSRHGLFLCQGNHDLFESPQKFDQGVIHAGLDLLRNESRTIIVRGQPVRIAGIRWGHDNTPYQQAVIHENIRQSLGHPIQPGDPLTILLAHHPHAFDIASEMGIPLTLSGHTHGGQLMLTPDLGAGSLMYRYWSGVYQRNGKHLVVSNGVGNWFPLRINAPAEIALLRLHRAG